jgi:hypothetical protein
MSATTPLVFRPSLAQRGLAALLCAGSWLVGIRSLFLLAGHFPALLLALRQAGAQGEPTRLLWLWVILSVLLALTAGLLCLFSLLGLILTEGTQVLVDEVGITVEHAGLPKALARRLGAGHLPWKQVLALEKGRLFFILRGGIPPEKPASPVLGDSRLPGLSEPGNLKFLMVDELERLVLLILERSPNIKI